MEIRKTALAPDGYYHIYNRGINGAPTFFEEKNYAYFLKQYAQYVHPFVKTYAYCLLGNHFHLLIQVRTEQDLLELFTHPGERALSWHVSNAFASWFQSYTRAINKVYDRSGPLFESPFKRKAVTEASYFSRLVTYIHHNPQYHGLVVDFRTYPHSSYHSYQFTHGKSRLGREETLKWYGDLASFRAAHQLETEELNEDWLIE